MKDRGMIKWMPFNSVSSGKKMVQHILFEKSKVEKPRLSEEQMIELEEKILESLHNEIPLRVVYYFHGRYQVKQNTFVLKIETNKKRIRFSDQSILYFDQILRIS